MEWEISFCLWYLTCWITSFPWWKFYLHTIKFWSHSLCGPYLLHLMDPDTRSSWSLGPFSLLTDINEFLWTNLKILAFWAASSWKESWSFSFWQFVEPNLSSNCWLLMWLFWDDGVIDLYGVVSLIKMHQNLRLSYKVDGTLI